MCTDWILISLQILCIFQIFPKKGRHGAEHSHPVNIFQGTIWSGCLSVFSALESFRTCQCSGAQQCAAPKRVHGIQTTVMVGNYMGIHWIQNWIHNLNSSYTFIYIYWYFIICQPRQSWPSLGPTPMHHVWPHRHHRKNPKNIPSPSCAASSSDKHRA